MLINSYNFQNFKSLSVLQFTAVTACSIEFISSSEAIKEDMIIVKEISDEGSVNIICIENKSDRYVFFADGEIISGAKQNRVLNTSVILEPKSLTKIPVSCVERGRWSFSRRNFSDTDYFVYNDLRAKKARKVKQNLDKKLGYYADQGDVWNEVNLKQKEHDIYSSTSNLSDLYENKRMTLNEFVNNFSFSSGSNGAAFFIYDSLLNIDIFGREEICSKYFTKLLRGAAFSALNLNEKKFSMDEKISRGITVKAIEHVAGLHHIVNPGVGAGIEKRFENEWLAGFELSFNGSLIHKAILNLNKS